MADEKIMAYLQDVLDAITDLQSCFVGFPNRYDLFEKDIMRKCVVERKVEIMGEAINRIKKTDSSVVIPNARAIIDTRNRIIHAYDNCSLNFYGVWYYGIYRSLKKILNEFLTNSMTVTTT